MRLGLATTVALILSACSGGGGSGGGDTAVVANRPPVAVADTVETPAGTSKLIDVMANDLDPDGDALTLTIIQQPANGIAYVDDGVTARPDDDTIVYTPNAAFSGPDEIVYTISDGSDGRASGSAMITVLPPPIPVTTAISDWATTIPNTPMNVYVLVNDLSDGSSPLAIAAMTAPVAGTAIIDDNGTPGTGDDYFKYTPTPGFVGTDSFIYELATGQRTVVQIDVNPDPTTPVGAIVTGSVIKGPVRDAIVRFYAIDADGNRVGSAIAQTVSDNDGQFTAVLPLPRTTLLAVSFGGSFIDETDSRLDPAQRRVISLASDEELESIIPATANYVAINAFSNSIMRSATLTASAGQFSTRYAQLRNEMNTALGFDPVTTAPVNPDAPDPTGSIVSRQYALALGGIATALNKVAVDLSQDAMSYGVVSGVIDDLSRCLLDGGNEAGPVNVLLDGLPVALPNDVNLNNEILRFRNNKIAVYMSTPLLQIDLTGCDGTPPPPPPPTGNSSPTAMDIDVASIDENSPPGTLVGRFATTDVDPGDSHTYTLVSGAGATGNGSFIISGNQLLSNVVFDFETQNTFSIRVRTDDTLSAPFERSFTISINDLNETPATISLDSNTIDENLPPGTLVGTLDVIDDIGDSHAYTLVGGAGSSGNANFNIVGDQLFSNAIFNFEVQNSYSIRISADDMVTMPFEQVFTITVDDINEAPTALGLDFIAINENLPATTVIGTFSTTDEDPADSHSYALVAGGIDNGGFSIVGNQLVSSMVFDFETKSSYSIRVSTDDSVTTPFARNFTITVNDINEAPTALSLDSVTIDENLPATTVIGMFSTTDEDPADSHSYALVAGGIDNGSFSIVGNQLVSSMVFDFETKSSYSIRVSTDDSVTTPFERNFTITVNDINEAPTALSLDTITIDENLPVATVIGSFSTTDEDPADSHSYALVAGGIDNGSFSIVGNQLVSSVVFNFETKSSYSIRVSTDDSVTTPFERNFTITVNDINETPTALSLDSITIDENLPASTVVGTFTTTDEDPADSHTYTLAIGGGDVDNGSFSIVGNQLISNAVFDKEMQSTYSIRIATDDSVTTPFERNFTITVNDINEAPEPGDDTTLTPVDGPVAIDVLANDTDPDSDPLTITVVTSPTAAGGTASLNDNLTPGDPSDDYIDYTPLALYEGSDSFSYTVSDGLLSTAATVTVYVSNLGYVLTVSPANGSSLAPVTQDIQIVFSQTMNSATLNGTTLVLSLSPAGGPALPATVTYNPGTLTATIDPSSDLLPGTLYYVFISDLIENLSGQPQGFPVQTSFTVIPDPTDMDSDGISDFDEITSGICLDPMNADSDFDGVGDGAEVLAGGDPCANQGQSIWYVDDDGVAGGWPTAVTSFGGYTSGTVGNPNYVLVAQGYYPDEINYGSNCDNLIFAGSQDPATPGAIVRNADGSPTTVVDMASTRNSEFADCSEVTLRDIRMTRGIGNGGTKGGGLRLSGTTTATLESVWLTDNITGDQGGGLGVSNFSVATVRRSLIGNNLVTGGKGGGGVWVGANATLDIADTLVIDNVATANGGGGLYFDPASTGTVLRTYLVGNTTTVHGGGIYILNNNGAKDTTVDVEDSVITGNSAILYGGGMFIDGVGAGGSQFRVQHNRIVDNSADDGAGLMLESTGSIAIVLNNFISGNHALFAGGGIAVSNGAPELSNNTIIHNRSGQPFGAAVAATGGGNPVIRNSIIWKNRANGRLLSSAVAANDNYSPAITLSDFNLLEVDKIGASDVDFVNDGVTPGFDSGFYLNQLTSTAVDTGGDTAIFLNLDTRLTAAAGPADAGVVDRGFHHPTFANFPADGYIETRGPTTNQIFLNNSDTGPNAVIVLIRPLVSGIPLGPGHHVVASLEGPGTGLAQLRDTAAVDPLSDGESVFLSDLGDGQYRAYLEAQGFIGFPTTIPLRIYVDEQILPVIFNIDRIP